MFPCFFLDDPQFSLWIHLGQEIMHAETWFVTKLSLIQHCKEIKDLNTTAWKYEKINVQFMNHELNILISTKYTC